LQLIDLLMRLVVREQARLRGQGNTKTQQDVSAQL